MAENFSASFEIDDWLDKEITEEEKSSLVNSIWSAVNFINLQEISDQNSQPVDRSISFYSQNGDDPNRVVWRARLVAKYTDPYARRSDIFGHPSLEAKLMIEEEKAQVLRVKNNPYIWRKSIIGVENNHSTIKVRQLHYMIGSTVAAQLRSKNFDQQSILNEFGYSERHTLLRKDLILAQALLGMIINEE